MDSMRADERESWQQKESVHVGLLDRINVSTLEFDREQSGLFPMLEDHNSGHAINTLEKDRHQLPKPGPIEHRWRWLLFAIIAVLVCLVVGLGAGLGSRLTNSPYATNLQSTSNGQGPGSTTTSSAIAFVTSGFTGITASDCGIRSSYTTNNSPTTFIFDCGTDYSQFIPSFSGNKTVLDLAKFVAYTFEECMETCAFYNTLNATAGPCLAITHAANLGAVYPTQRANCWLKSVRGQQYYGKQGTYLSSSAYIDST